MSVQEIEELRGLILSERGEKKGPFSKALRKRLSSFLKAKWKSGEPLKQVGRELGLSDHTVQYWRARWGERDMESVKLRRVEVVAEKARAPRRTVAVHGPAGTRIDALSLDEVAALWSRLWCVPQQWPLVWRRERIFLRAVWERLSASKREGGLCEIAGTEMTTMTEVIATAMMASMNTTTTKRTTTTGTRAPVRGVRGHAC